MSDTPPLRTGGRLLVDQLVLNGCDRIFTVPGESFLAVLDALHDTPEIETVVCRQEGGVAYMADADGKLTGRPGVAFVTRGPGATNASAGVHVAFQDSTPMILFVGDLDRRDKDREGFQEVDFPAFFGPIAKWAARIDDARRIPEYVARAWRVATSGRPGPVVLAIPEDMLRDEVGVPDRPPVPPVVESPDPAAIATLFELLKEAAAPVAIVGGADWSPCAAHHFANFAARHGIPTAAAFRRQDAIANDCRAYAGNLGYGPNPKLQQRVRDADLLLVVGARLGEATTDGYTLITPDHPGQTIVHVHPDPNELGRVYHADLPIVADMGEFAQVIDSWADPELVRFGSGDEAHAEWLEWSEPKPRDGVTLDLGPCVKQLREALPADTIVCNGAGNFSGWVHRYWRYASTPTQLAPTSGTMGYGLPAAVAAALRFRDRAVLCVAGDGDFLMNGQELATAAQYGADLIVLIVDNGSYGTIRMHQEREYPARLSATELRNPDFAALARAYGGWAATIERTEEFAPALQDALGRKGIRLLHCKTDVEVISHATTVTRLRERASA
ncbi:thiamine pyrophosphate-binding protein [Sphingomonas sp. KRR8]|uniref:thiamine pyrophosphate-binding protein n=1 Tax=Sphingomonas sp. KRR8 TaxID=2942996 RepID=UPI0020222E25|nr:thiamine pyrophosphate-binding protein [Sphingomonas sp. KRR8]URD60650.1 thiamine pyrophosphate-binding protein [Sphingomonas sp. KRR8]